MKFTFPVNRFTKWLSYIHQLPIEYAESNSGEPLYLHLIQGRYQLSTDYAVYSFDDKYDNFSHTFNKIDISELNLSNILVLGGGLGSVPYILQKEHNVTAHFTLVEADINIIRLFTKYTLPRLKSEVTIAYDDAASFITNTDLSYDLIVIDIFIDTQVPEKFRHLSFLQKCAQHLNKNGVLLFNWMVTDKEMQRDYETFQSLCFKNVFPNAGVIITKYNRILISNKALLLSR